MECKNCGKRGAWVIDAICRTCYSTRPRRETYAELEARMRGIYFDQDAELCRRQMEELRRGCVLAQIDTNIYGFCVRDTHNLGGGRLSPNFNTLDECERWAEAWVMSDERHELCDHHISYAPRCAYEVATYDAPLC